MQLHPPGKNAPPEHTLKHFGRQIGGNLPFINCMRSATGAGRVLARVRNYADYR